MAIILERNELEGKGGKYILLGAGRTPGNFGSSEEPFVVVCDENGSVSCLEDFADTIKVISVDGKSPSDLCNSLK